MPLFAEDINRIFNNPEENEEQFGDIVINTTDEYYRGPISGVWIENGFLTITNLWLANWENDEWVKIKSGPTRIKTTLIKTVQTTEGIVLFKTNDLEIVILPEQKNLPFEQVRKNT